MGRSSIADNPSKARAGLLLVATLFTALSLSSAIAVAEAPEPASATQPTPATADSKDQKANPRKIAIVLIALFGASTLIGAGLGKRYSPDFEDDAILAEYVAKHSSITRNYVKESAPDGNLTILCKRTYRFPVGIFTWVYDPDGTDPIQVVYDRGTDGEQIKNRPPTAVSVSALSAMGFISATPSLFQTGDQVQTVIGAVAGPDKVKMIIGTLLTAASGFLIGYWLCHSEHPDKKLKSFSDLLKNRLFWQVVEKKRPSGDKGWKLYDSGSEIKVASLDNGTFFTFIPGELPIALSVVGEYQLAQRINQQLGIPTNYVGSFASSLGFGGLKPLGGSLINPSLLGGSLSSLFGTGLPTTNPLTASLLKPNPLGASVPNPTSPATTPPNSAPLGGGVTVPLRKPPIPPDAK